MCRDKTIQYEIFEQMAHNSTKLNLPEEDERKDLIDTKKKKDMLMGDPQSYSGNHGKWNEFIISWRMSLKQTLS